MPAFAQFRAHRLQTLHPRFPLTCVLRLIFALFLLAFSATLCPAASVRGVVTDATGAKVTGANVVLIS